MRCLLARASFAYQNTRLVTNNGSLPLAGPRRHHSFGAVYYDYHELQQAKTLRQ